MGRNGASLKASSSANVAAVPRTSALGLAAGLVTMASRELVAAGAGFEAEIEVTDIFSREGAMARPVYAFVMLATVMLSATISQAAPTKAGNLRTWVRVQLRPASGRKLETAATLVRW